MAKRYYESGNLLFAQPVSIPGEEDRTVPSSHSHLGPYISPRISPHSPSSQALSSPTGSYSSTGSRRSSPSFSAPLEGEGISDTQGGPSALKKDALMVSVLQGHGVPDSGFLSDLKRVQWKQYSGAINDEDLRHVNDIPYGGERRQSPAIIPSELSCRSSSPSFSADVEPAHITEEQERRLRELNDLEKKWENLPERPSSSSELLSSYLPSASFQGYRNEKEKKPDVFVDLERITEEERKVSELKRKVLDLASAEDIVRRDKGGSGGKGEGEGRRRKKDTSEVKEKSEKKGANQGSDKAKDEESLSNTGHLTEVYDDEFETSTSFTDDSKRKGIASSSATPASSSSSKDRKKSEVGRDDDGSGTAIKSSLGGRINLGLDDTMDSDQGGFIDDDDSRHAKNVYDKENSFKEDDTYGEEEFINTDSFKEDSAKRDSFLDNLSKSDSFEDTQNLSDDGRKGESGGDDDDAGDLDDDAGSFKDDDDGGYVADTSEDSGTDFEDDDNDNGHVSKAPKAKMENVSRSRIRMGLGDDDSDDEDG
jgi:hypothetical protein